MGIWASGKFLKPEIFFFFLRDVEKNIEEQLLIAVL